MIFFQGEKNEGFNVLYQNMKGGITAARELGDFLRERAKIEEDNSKAQIKLANKLTPATVSNTCGTFTPLLLAFKVTTDKLSGIHNQWSMKLNDLLREVLKYNDEQQKKHKQVRIFILAYYFALFRFTLTKKISTQFLNFSQQTSL